MADYTFTIGPVNATGGTHPEYYSGQVRLKQTPNDNNNTSLVEYWFEIWPNIESGWNYTQNNQVTFKLDGVTIIDTGNYGSVSLAGKSSSNKLVLVHGTKTIAHNADGTKNVSVEAKYRNSSSNQTNMNYILVSGNKDLHTTRTAGQITSCPDLTLTGSTSHTVGWSSSQEGAYYQVVWKNGDTVLHTGAMLEGTGSAMSATWADVPVSIAEAAPSGTTLTLTAVLNTYSSSTGGTLIGTDSDTFTVTFDTTVMGPILSDITLAYTGKQGTSVVGGKTSATATWTATAQTGASIASSSACYAKYNATTGTYTDVADTSVSSGSPAALAALPNLAISGAESQFAVKVTVTDSRGQSSTKYSSMFTAFSLSAPSVSMVSAERCNSEGIPDAAGNYFLAYVTYSITPLGAQNEKHLGISYYYTSDESTPSSWINPTVADPDAYSATVTLGPFAMPTGKSDPVVVVAYAWDAYTSSSKASKSTRLKGGNVFIDGIENSHRDKISVAFGMVSDENETAKFGWEVSATAGLKVISDYGLNSSKSIVFDAEDGIQFKDHSGTVTNTIYPTEQLISSSEIDSIIALIT